MKTHEHREGNITHWGVAGGGRTRSRIALGEIPYIDEDDGCSQPPWHMYTYVTNQHMYPRT